MSYPTHWPRPLATLLWTIFLTFVIAVAVAHGSGIRGVVRDAVTGDPVPGAGVFVYEPGGTYTGYNTATDAAGEFFIGNMLPGTYDLGVFVDDYEPTYVRGVVVLEDPVDVELDAVPSPTYLGPPWPNPARDHVVFRVHLEDATPVRLVVTDVTGRVIKGWRADGIGAGEREIGWDLRDARGNLVAPGCYFILFRTQGLVHRRAFALIR